MPTPATRGRELDITADRELEEILREGRVDLTLSGHHHALYPAVKDGLRDVSQSCLGAGPRALLGTQQRSLRSFTHLDLRDDGTIAVSALVEPDFTRPLAAGAHRRAGRSAGARGSRPAPAPLVEACALRDRQRSELS